MKKKLLIALLTITAAVCGAFGFAACGDNSNNGGSGGNGNNGGNTGNNDKTETGFENFEYTVKDGVYEITGVKDVHITEAIIPDKVTSIGLDAFRGCAELKTLTIPDGVTYIGYGAFDGCESIETISIPAFALANISQEKLKTVTITSGEIKKDLFKIYYTDDGLTFSNITSVYIGSKVTSIEKFSFNYCDSLANISVDSDNLNYCADSGILYNKQKTEIIHVPKKIQGNIVLPDGIASIGNLVFRGCSGLTSITIPDGVTSIGNSAFWGCRSLTSINIPDRVTSIGEMAFMGCSGLTSIILGKNITLIGNDAFKSCGALIIYCEVEEKPSGWRKDWNILKCPVVWNYKNNDKDEDGYVYTVVDGLRYQLKDGIATVYKQSRNISGEIVIPSSVSYKEANYSVNSIGDYAFSGCSSLTSITIPDGITFIGSGVFSGCSSLATITVDKGNLNYYSEGNCLIEKENKTLIAGCKNSFIPEGVTSIGWYAFNGCSGLTSVTIPDSVTSIGWFAFDGCSGLTKINYGGTKEQWNSIEKGLMWNDNTGKYTIYCANGEQITKS